MSNLENLLSQLDESQLGQEDDEICAVLSSVPWARESLHTYLASHRPDLEKEVLARVDELLTSA